MEAKKPVAKKETKKVSKLDKSIKKVYENSSFNKHEVISENSKVAVVAFGISSTKYCELLKLDLAKNKKELLKAKGGVSFSEFVKEVKPVEEIPVVDAKEVKY